MESGIVVMKKKTKSQSTVTSKKTGKAEVESAVKTVLRSDCFRIMNEDGSVDLKADPKLDKTLLLDIYRHMALTRAFDERGMMLQRQGRIGFYVPSFGQEAIQIGTAATLEKRDWGFPSYREPGLFLYRGADIFSMLCNLLGNSGDLCKGRQMPVHYSFSKLKLFSVSSPIATQLIQAVGVAMASKISKTKEVAISYCGDGGTSENDFHSALTFAGAYQAPAVFIITNNQYAISVPLSKQTGAKRLVDKAVGYGMPGVAVDGNDVLAVYLATKEAVDRARRGDGPTLIECVTFRMGPHSSSDDPSRYRDEKMFQAWAKRDPIKRFKNYLETKKLWDEKKEKSLQEELKAQLAEAVERAEKQPAPTLGDLFDDVFSELTPQLKKQKAQLLYEGELRGKFENTSEAFPL
ncbi:MAG: pyruvate dehydrogenase (acetyl-transferring) E1 component subunit alpha [Proteobacteria bacterium]|nr:pyruvate dehydrogenase (acetyl-transferring) E1 component subunit alpha [Pseudomonadota bacterium]